MKSELSFLLELLLEHKLPKQTQKALKDRITEVEVQGQRPIPINQAPPSTFTARPIAERPAPTDQPESTRRLLEKHADLMPNVPRQPAPTTNPPPIQETQPAITASNAATQQALMQRQQMINDGITGPKRGGPLQSPKAHGTPRG